MCVANLNVSTQPCNHRWYTLIRPCSSQTNLANCPEKLKLQGWETRRESCPWCGVDDSEAAVLDESTHRLFGGSGSRSRSGSLGTTVSPLPSADWKHRRQSSATNSTTSLSRSNSSRGFSQQDDEEDVHELGRGEKARMMNWRLDVYLMGNPDRKRQLQEDESFAPEAPAPESQLRRSSSIRRSGSVLGKKMKKGMRLGKTIFKG